MSDMTANDSQKYRPSCSALLVG